MAEVTAARGRDGHVLVTIPAADPLLYADLTVLEHALVARDAAGTVTIQIDEQHWGEVSQDLAAAGLAVPEPTGGPGEGCSRDHAVTAVRGVQPGQPLLVTGPEPAQLLKTVLDALDGAGKAAVVALGGQPGLLVATAVVGPRPHSLGTPESLLGVHPLTGAASPAQTRAALVGCAALVLYGLEHAPHELVQQLCARVPAKVIAVGDPSGGTGSFFCTDGAVEALFEDRVYPVRPDDNLLWRLWCGSSVLAGEYGRLLPDAGPPGEHDCVVSWGDPGPATAPCTLQLHDPAPGGGEQTVEHPNSKQRALMKKLADDVGALGVAGGLEPGTLVQLLRPAGGHPAGAIARVATSEPITVAIGTEQVPIAPATFELTTGAAPRRRRETARMQIPGVRGVSTLRIGERFGLLVPTAARLVLETDGGELDAGRLLQLRGAGGTVARRGPLPSRLLPHPALQRCQELLTMPSRDYAVERVGADRQAAGGFERFPFDDVFAQPVEIPVGFEPLCLLYKKARRFHKQQEQRFTSAALRQQSAAKKSTRKKQQRCRNVAAEARLR